MSKTTVTFSVSTKYPGSRVEEIFTLDQLGIDENLTDEELEKEVEETYQDWVWDNIDSSWSIDS